jgi:hypothetical protein
MTLMRITHEQISKINSGVQMMYDLRYLADRARPSRVNHYPHPIFSLLGFSFGLASVERVMEPYAKDSFLMRLDSEVGPRSMHLTSAAPIACDWL